MLGALSLTMESAHVLELPQKLQYSAQMYSAVNTTLYRYFSIVGGVYQIGAILSALLLTLLVRKRRVALRWTAGGAFFLLAAFIAWVAVVAPVNGQIAQALVSAPDSVPGLWIALRARWEFGHAAGFVLQLAGYAALVWSCLRELPSR
jgi:hypothetical protein